MAVQVALLDKLLRAMGTLVARSVVDENMFLKNNIKTVRRSKQGLEIELERRYEVT
jgi:hypothetical protein